MHLKNDPYWCDSLPHAPPAAIIIESLGACEGASLPSCSSVAVALMPTPLHPHALYSQGKRSLCQPNPGFLLQLKNFEKSLGIIAEAEAKVDEAEEAAEALGRAAVTGDEGDEGGCSNGAMV